MELVLITLNQKRLRDLLTKGQTNQPKLVILSPMHKIKNSAVCDITYDAIHAQYFFKTETPTSVTQLLLVENIYLCYSLDVLRPSCPMFTICPTYCFSFYL